MKDDDDYQRVDGKKDKKVDDDKQSHSSDSDDKNDETDDNFKSAGNKGRRSSVAFTELYSSGTRKNQSIE